MSRYKKLFTNTLIFTISEFASKFLMFFMLPLYTSYMNSGDYGVSELINTTISLLIPILTLSIFSSVMRFCLESSTSKKQSFMIGLRTTLLGIVILFFMYPVLKRFESINNYLMLFYLMYIANALDLLFSHFARGLSKIKILGIAGIIKTLIVITLNIGFLVWLNMGVKGYLLSYMLASLVSAIFLALSLKFWKYLSFEETDKQLKGDMIKYSLPLIPNSLSWWMNNSANKYIVNFYFGTAELGLFSAASKVPAILTAVQNIFSQALVLSVIEEYDSDDCNEYYKELYEIYNLIMVISCFMLILFVKVIATLLFSGEFYMAWKYVPFLLIGTIFGAMSGFLGTLYSATKKTKGLFFTTLIGGVSAIVLNIIIIPQIGVMGASISTTISYFIVWFIRIIDTKKYVKLNINHVKNTIVYMLLILQSILVINIEPSLFIYGFEVIIGLLVLFLNHNILKTTINRVVYVIKLKLKK